MLQNPPNPVVRQEQSKDSAVRRREGRCMSCLPRQAAVNTMLFSPEHTSLQTARHRSNNMLSATRRGHTHTHTGRTSTPSNSTCLHQTADRKTSCQGHTTSCMAHARKTQTNPVPAPQTRPVPSPSVKQHPKMHPAWAQQPASNTPGAQTHPAAAARQPCGRNARGAPGGCAASAAASRQPRHASFSVSNRHTNRLTRHRSDYPTD
jgi:hypothetical protein